MTDPVVRRRAAELVGRGVTVRETAAAVGRNEKTVRTWLKKPELAAVVRQVRQDAIDPTVDGVLREALGAITRDGRPDHPTRLRAAALLLANPAAGEAPQELLPEGAIVLYPGALELLADG